MVYRTPLLKRMVVLDYLTTQLVPRTYLEIARGVGYQKSTTVRDTLDRLTAEGSVHRTSQIKPNGCERWLCAITHQGIKELLLLRQRMEEDYERLIS